MNVLRNNHREAMVTRFKCLIERVRKIDVDDILVERNDVVYYCFLRNRHVAMVREYIFDSEFEQTLPRSRSGLRVSSEMERIESIHGAIQKCYRIQRK